MLTELKSFKFVLALVLQFKTIENDNETKRSTFYLNSKAETIIYQSDIDDVFESVYNAIISNIQKSLEKGSFWITDSVLDHTINNSKYNPLVSSYTKLLKKLGHSKKILLKY